MDGRVCPSALLFLFAVLGCGRTELFGAVAAEAGSGAGAVGGAGGAGGTGMAGTPDPPPCVPRVENLVPASGAQGVPTRTSVSASFDDCAPAPDGPFSVTLHVDFRGRTVEGTALWDARARVMRFEPARPLGLAATYEATLDDGHGFTQSWSFTTTDGAWLAAESVGRGGAISIGVDREGRGVVTHETNAEARGMLFARRFTLDAGLTGEEEVVRATSGASVLVHEVRRWERGVLVVWEELTADGSAVLASRGGIEAGWGSPNSISTGAVATLEDVALDADGFGAVLYSEPADASGASRLLLVRVEPGGFGPPELVADAMPIGDARVGLERDGGARVVWGSWQTTGRVLSRFRAPDGGYGAPAVLRDATARAPFIATSEDGSALVVWEEGDGGFGDVIAARYAPAGGWGYPLRLDTSVREGLHAGFYARVAVDPFGEGVLLWVNRANFADGTHADDVRAQRFEASEGWAHHHVRLDPGGGSGEWALLSEQALVLDPQGNGFATFGQGTPAAAHVSRFLAASGWQGRAKLADSATAPVVAVDPGGRAAVAWSAGGEVLLTRFVER